MGPITIRPAAQADAAALLAVYAPYVTDTAISFETEVPGEAEFRDRIRRVTARYPYLVAERAGEIVGYAYAHPFVGRAAYDYSAEATIYLSAGEQGRGTGRALYEALEEALRDMGITNLYACIGLPEQPDEYLTSNSMDFHAHMGFTLAGTFRNCGRKFGRWYHMVWMEKLIAPHRPDPGPIRPWPEIQNAKSE